MCHSDLLHRALRVGAVAAISGIAAAPGVALAQPAPPDTPPTVLTHVDATYPPGAQKHADVVLFVVVDTDGHVTDVVVHESGGKELDDAAIAAVRQWTFTPATHLGKPASARVRVPFHFAPPQASQPSEQNHAPTTTVPGGVSRGNGAAGPETTGPAPESVTTVPGPRPPAAPTTLYVPTAEVEVHGRSAPPFVNVSDFNLHVGRLRDVPRANASEILKLAPAIFLTNEGGEGHAEQVFLRGFDAREGQDIEFTVGGVPINESGNLHGNGYADTHFIIPELVDRLRVVEGPFDPRQGNYAVAGSADYQLGLEQRGLTGKYTVGSFGSERALVTFGPRDESVGTFAAAEAYKTDGYGKNRDAQRGSAMAQYEGQLAHGSYRLTGQVYTSTYHSAGFVREDDYEAGRIGFYDTYDTGQGGNSTRASIAGDIETKSGDTALAQQVFLVKRTMRVREDFTGYLLDVQEPIQNPHPQRGDLLDLDVDELTVGARGWARLKAQALGQPQQLEIGYFGRYDSAAGSQQRLAPTTLIPYRTDTNLQSNLVDVGLYGAADLKPVSWLTLKGGLRADVFSFDVNDLCAVHSIDNPSKTNPPGDASCLDQQDFGAHREPNQRADTVSTAVLPKATVLVGPLQHMTLSASYGQGVRSIDPGYITQDVRTPFAGVQALEGGGVYAGPVGPVELVARSIFFQTHVDRDYIFDQTVGRNVLGVGTTRTGWLGALRATGEWFDESANLTLVKSEYDDDHLLVPYIPDAVFRSDTAVWANMPWKVRGEPVVGLLSAGISYVGRRHLPFNALGDPLFTVDANASVTWTHYQLGISSTNLLDDKYRLGEYNYASSFQTGGPPTLVPGRLFAAGAPRAVFATFGVNFGGA